MTIGDGPEDQVTIHDALAMGGDLEPGMRRRCGICQMTIAGHPVTRYAVGAAAKIECQNGDLSVGFTDRDLYEICLAIGKTPPDGLTHQAVEGGYAR